MVASHERGNRKIQLERELEKTNLTQEDKEQMRQRSAFRFRFVLLCFFFPLLFLLLLKITNSNPFAFLDYFRKKVITPGFGERK